VKDSGRSRNSRNRIPANRMPDPDPLFGSKG
jgi:hypothetical protein